jgi:hypothetical protein
LKTELLNFWTYGKQRWFTKSSCTQFLSGSFNASPIEADFASSTEPQALGNAKRREESQGVATCKQNKPQTKKASQKQTKQKTAKQLSPYYYAHTQQNIEFSLN